MNQVPKVSVGDRVKIPKYKNIFNKGHTENWTREIFIIDSGFNNNPQTCTIKHLNAEKVLGSYVEKAMLSERVIAE